MYVYDFICRDEVVRTVPFLHVLSHRHDFKVLLEVFYRHVVLTVLENLVFSLRKELSIPLGTAITPISPEVLEIPGIPNLHKLGIVQLERLNDCESMCVGDTNCILHLVISTLNNV